MIGFIKPISAFPGLNASLLPFGPAGRQAGRPAGRQAGQRSVFLMLLALRPGKAVIATVKQAVEAQREKAMGQWHKLK